MLVLAYFAPRGRARCALQRLELCEMPHACVFRAKRKRHQGRQLATLVKRGRETPGAALEVLHRSPAATGHREGDTCEAQQPTQ